MYTAVTHIVLEMQKIITSVDTRQAIFWASNYIFYSNLVIKSASLVFFLLTAFLIFIALFKLVKLNQCCLSFKTQV